MQTKQISMEVQIKGNPLVSKAPTRKFFYLLENSATRIHIQTQNKVVEVPYSDCFHVEENWVAQGIQGRDNLNSCVVQVSTMLVWVKSTLMKSFIRSSSESEIKTVMSEYSNLLKQFPFVQQKRPPVASV